MESKHISVSESTCAGCGSTYDDQLFDFKQLQSIATPLLCPKCLSASIHKPPSERVGFLSELLGKALMLIAMLPMLTHAAAPVEAPAGWERTVLTAVILAEAGGEGAKGMEAVYEVIWTRGVERKRSLYEVVTRRKQFSCLNSTTPAELVQRMSHHKYWDWVHDELLRFPPLTTHTCPAELLALSTTRANHYHAKGVKPYWAKGHKPVVIGNHLFYRLK